MVSGTSSTGVKPTRHEVHLPSWWEKIVLEPPTPGLNLPILPKWYDNDGLGKLSASLKMEGGQIGPPWEDYNHTAGAAYAQQGATCFKSLLESFPRLLVICTSHSSLSGVASLPGIGILLFGKSF